MLTMSLKRGFNNSFPYVLFVFQPCAIEYKACCACYLFSWIGR